ncbi:MAG: prolipoprotein diacylglyceryl transferase [Candidatus Moraniibacteriota bacterium]|jgi:phosphatidylglycerol---prolipoprotein diacylglyceryl transferase
MIEFYQNLPSYISPIVFSIGNFSLYWYSLMWLVSFVVVYLLLIFRIKKGEGNFKKSFIQDIVANSIIGALIGGRLGYVIFYDLPYYIINPLQIISPYNFTTGEWSGIYGMSYHGGIIGVAIAIIWTARKNKKDILEVADFIMPVIPIGYMFGRIGNFLNAELIGRVTESKLGMYFNGDVVARYPSQLVEAFLEGFVLFIILWSLRNKNLPKGMMVSFYLIGYSVARFGVEFIRQPDEHLGFILGQVTMGQLLSLIMLFTGCVMLLRSLKNK